MLQSVHLSTTSKKLTSNSTLSVHILSYVGLIHAFGCNFAGGGGGLKSPNFKVFGNSNLTGNAAEPGLAPNKWKE